MMRYPPAPYSDESTSFSSLGLVGAEMLGPRLNRRDDHDAQYKFANG